MEKYVGLDVSMEETSVCVVDGGGNIVFEGKTSSQPDALTKLLRAKASDAARIALENRLASLLAVAHTPGGLYREPHGS
jgi:transposase